MHRMWVTALLNVAVVTLPAAESPWLMPLAGDIIRGRTQCGAWSSAGLAMCIALNLAGMQSDKRIQAKWQEWGNVSPKEQGGVLILIPWPPIKLQKDFQEQVKEPCCHQRSSSSTREGCAGVHISTAQGCSSFLYSHVEVWDFSQSVTVAWLSPGRERTTLQSQT